MGGSLGGGKAKGKGGFFSGRGKGRTSSKGGKGNQGNKMVLTFEDLKEVTVKTEGEEGGRGRRESLSSVKRSVSVSLKRWGGSVGKGGGLTSGFVGRERKGGEQAKEQVVVNPSALKLVLVWKGGQRIKVTFKKEGTLVSVGVNLPITRTALLNKPYK